MEVVAVAASVAGRDFCASRSERDVSGCAAVAVAVAFAFTGAGDEWWFGGGRVSWTRGSVGDCTGRVMDVSGTGALRGDGEGMCDGREYDWKAGTRRAEDDEKWRWWWRLRWHERHTESARLESRLGAFMAGDMLVLSRGELMWPFATI